MPSLRSRALGLVLDDDLVPQLFGSLRTAKEAVEKEIKEFYDDNSLLVVWPNPVGDVSYWQATVYDSDGNFYADWDYRVQTVILEEEFVWAS